MAGDVLLVGGVLEDLIRVLSSKGTLVVEKLGVNSVVNHATLGLPLREKDKKDENRTKQG